MEKENTNSGSVYVTVDGHLNGACQYERYG